MADDHADDRPSGGDPRVYERADARLRKKDLIPGTSDRHVRVPGEVTLMCPPSEFGGRRAFLEEALEGAQREGITLDEWVRAQHFDPALSERAEWAGLNDDLLLAMTPRGRGRAA